MPYFKTQDSVDFAVTAEEMVVNDTVRIMTTVTALITGPGAEDRVHVDIRAALREFIDTEWQFQNVTRGSDSTGYEQLRLEAFCRVHQRENHALDKRREAASRPGLQISWAHVDNSVPLEVVSEAESRLRRRLIEKVKAEAALINDAMGIPYRINRISFERLGAPARRHAALPSGPSLGGLGAARLAEDSPEAEPLGNAARIAMRASVVLGFEVAEPG